LEANDGFSSFKSIIIDYSTLKGQANEILHQIRSINEHLIILGTCDAKYETEASNVFFENGCQEFLVKPLQGIHLTKVFAPSLPHHSGKRSWSMTMSSSKLREAIVVTGKLKLH
jgi:response regulator RpfG family c-di-GMP phosphodiesterase